VGHSAFSQHALAAGTLAGISVAAIFFMRMRIEEMEGKASTKQPSWGGFEVEDILYLMPLVSLFDGMETFLVCAVIGAPTFALGITVAFVRTLRRHNALSTASLVKPTSRP
jgi:hypothetical protein